MSMDYRITDALREAIPQTALALLNIGIQMRAANLLKMAEMEQRINFTYADDPAAYDAAREALGLGNTLR